MTLEFTAQIPGRGFDVELTVGPGETVAVMGPNGAGKSTLLAAIAGLLRPDGGAGTLAGRPLFGDGVWAPPHRRGVCLLSQDPLLFPHLSVLDNVAFAPRSAGTRQSEARDQARRWLAEAGVEDLADRMPAVLSGGQAQRVAIARALAAEPALLLLDEPLSALDVAAAPEVRRTLRRVLSGRSAVVVTHDPLDALILADRLVVLQAGAVAEDGRVREVLERPRSAFAAGLAGLNLLTGTATADGIETLDGMRLHAAGPPVAGADAAAVFSPRAVSVFTRAPGGSPRNLLAVTVTDVESHSDVVRVRAGHLSADITAAAAAELDLAPGMPVYFAVKATEVSVYAL